MANNFVVIGSEAVCVAPDNAGVSHNMVCRPRGHVTITPLSVAQQNAFNLSQMKAKVTANTTAVKKVLLKAVNKDNGKEYKLFTLRNVKVDSCESLKSVIKSQLQNDIIDDSFDVGFMQSNSAVSFRSTEDLAEVWEQLRMGKNITLWCDGMISMAPNKKRKCPFAGDDKEIPDKKKSKRGTKDTTREDQVEELLEALKAKHGKVHTPMQFRIWAEMIIGGIHASHDEPPSTTMFSRSGSVNVMKKSSSNAVVQVVEKLASVLTPKSSNGPAQSNSPAKIIENRSKCYK